MGTNNRNYISGPLQTVATTAQRYKTSIILDPELLTIIDLLEKYETDASNNWNSFYQQHQNRQTKILL